MIKEKTEFSVKGNIVRGYFYKPEFSDDMPIPLIIMFNGFATHWCTGTLATIEAFTEAGFATLNFDYRNFGISGGEPRQLLDIPEQLNDCRAAIEHVKAQSWVDQKKIVLWGSSLGGGHAISMASEYPDIAALVAQVPHCCSRAAFKCVSLASVFKGVSAAIMDGLGSLVGRQPVLLPVVSEPEDYGVMNHPGWKT